jgi:hypothetical protein
MQCHLKPQSKEASVAICASESSQSSTAKFVAMRSARGGRKENGSCARAKRAKFQQVQQRFQAVQLRAQSPESAAKSSRDFKKCSREPRKRS